MKRIILLLFTLLLLGCDGGETAVLPTAPSQSPTTFPSRVPTGETATFENMAVSPTAPPTNTPIGNETAVPPTNAAPLTLETVVAQTRIAEQNNRPPRLNHYVRVQLDLPVDWELATNDSFTYRGTNGSFRLSVYRNDELTTLAEMCASDEVAANLGLVGYEREMDEINGRAVCLAREVGSEAVPYALVQYPTPLIFLFPDINGNVGPFQYLMLYSVAQSVTVPQVLETLEFPETPDAVAYLRGVVDEYQAGHVFHEQVDFVTWEANALSRLTPDSTLEEAHQLIFELFDVMRAATKHNHLGFYTLEQAESLLFAPARARIGLHFDSEGVVWLVEPGSPAEAAGMQIGDRLLAINGAPLQEIRLNEGENEIAFERGGEVRAVAVTPADYSNLLPPNGRLLTDNIAYLETFGFNNVIEAELSRYVTLVHDQIAALDAPNRCWVLDLRRNRGGSKHALQGGIGPFAGNGQLYADWEDVDKIYTTWYENGRIYGEHTVPFDVVPERPYTMIDTRHTVAILVSELTASGGELATLIVSTQPENTARIFGEKTVGLSSSVEFLALYDKSVVHIPRAAWVDLDGNFYPEGIIPDELLDVVFDSRYGTLDDPVVQTAVAWLENERDCR